MSTENMNTPTEKQIQEVLAGTLLLKLPGS
jgi:hypothetical protein